METRTAEITFEHDGVELGAYGARPDHPGPYPAVLLIPDVRGLYDHYRDVAGRFAEAGFFTLALDLYSREGAPLLTDFESIFRWMRELPDARVLGDIHAAAVYLESHPLVRPEAIAVAGFCMGGQYALMAACTVPGLAACVSWYGLLRYDERTAIKPRSPLDLAPRLACPYLGMFGEEDELITADDVAALREILEREGKRFEIVRYANAGHAFHNDTRPELYREHAARDSWQRAVTFLREHLGGPA